MYKIPDDLPKKCTHCGVTLRRGGVYIHSVEEYKWNAKTKSWDRHASDSDFVELKCCKCEHGTY